MNNIKNISKKDVFRAWFWLALWTFLLVWNIKESVAETLNNSFISTSEKYIWRNEVKNFLTIFWINEGDELWFFAKVTEIQTANNLKQDWIIGQNTLRVIYRKYYQNIPNLPLEVKSRIDLEKWLNWYRNNNPSWYQLSWLKSSFDNDFFYWQWVWENINWTFINRNLHNYFWKNSLPWNPSYNWGNSIQVDKLPNWKYYLVMYVNWKMSVLTYVSPWLSSNRTPQNREDSIDFLRKHYISWSYPKRSSWNWWAVMPYAYEINSSIWIYWHIWMVNWNQRSHGCVRTPWFYQQAIFNLLEKNWSRRFRVKVWWLY